MATEKIPLKLFIASSSEVKEERDRCVLILFQLNKAYPHLHLEPVMWEYDLPKISHPTFNSLQDAINLKLDECKLAAFIFYSKIGIYTEEEFNYSQKKQLPSFVFFKVPVSETISSTGSYKKLVTFRERLENLIAPIDYNNLNEFEYEFYKNLNLYLAQKYSGEPGLVLTIQELQETLREQGEAKRELEERLISQVQKDDLKARALAHVKNGNYDEAEKHLRQSAVEQIKIAASTYFELGKIKELQLLYQEAFDNYELAARIQPDNANYLKVAGVIAMRYLGKYDVAKEYFEKALALDILNSDVDNIPKSLYNLAEVFEEKGDFDKAVTYGKQALDFIDQNQIPDTSFTSLYYGLIGNGYVYLNKFGEAIEYLEQGLEKAQKYFNEEPSRLALIRNNLGIAYYNLHEYFKAIKHYESSLEISTNTHNSADGLDLATLCTNLAMAYVAVNRTDEALERLKIALNMVNEILPGENPKLGFIYRTFGMAYEKMGDYDKAIGFLERANAITMKFAGEKHLDVGTEYVFLIGCGIKKGDYEKALEYSRKELARSLQANEQDMVAEMHYQIGSIYFKTNQFDLAIENYQSAINVTEKVFKNERSKIALYSEKLALCYYESGDIDKTLDTLKTVLNIRRKINALYNESYAVFFYLGLAYRDKKQYAKAIKNLKTALQISQGEHANRDDRSIECYYQIGLCFHENAEYKKAIKFYRAALEHGLSFYKDDMGPIGVFYNNIGQCYYRLGKIEEAIESYQVALPILKKYFDPEDENIQICETNLELAQKAKSGDLN